LIWRFIRRVIMSTRAEDLAERIAAFNQEAISLVEKCPDKDWQKECQEETWSVAVVARHIPAAHYRAFKLVKMIVAREELPQVSMESVHEMNARHAEEHANCTKDEVLDLLRKYGEPIAEYISQLGDDDLDRIGRLEAMGGDATAEKFIENVILVSCGEHLASMKAATGR
jgi:hypothetical protein